MLTEKWWWRWSPINRILSISSVFVGAWAYLATLWATSPIYWDGLVWMAVFPVIWYFLEAVLDEEDYQPIFVAVTLRRFRALNWQITISFRFSCSIVIEVSIMAQLSDALGLCSLLSILFHIGPPSRRWVSLHVRIPSLAVSTLQGTVQRLATGYLVILRV